MSKVVNITKMGCDEATHDKDLVTSFLAGIFSREEDGAEARSPYYSTVFEKLNETAIGELLGMEAEGAEAVPPYTITKQVKARWTLARILGITLPARRQRRSSSTTSSPTTSPVRASSQSGGGDRFRSESILPRGAPSSSINVASAGMVMGEAVCVEGKGSSGKGSLALKRVFSGKARRTASSRASAKSVCME